MAEGTNTGTNSAADNNTQGQQQSQQNQQTQTQTQQPADKGGDKTYTQADLDRIVQERLARAKSKADPAPTEQNADPAEGANSALEAQIAAMRSAMVSSEIKATMAVSGVQAEKVERGARLIDPAKCTDEQGMPDKAKITAEIEAMIKDFPEMKVAAADTTSGFRIGADSNAPKLEQTDKISEIFGNKKG